MRYVNKGDIFAFFILYGEKKVLIPHIMFNLFQKNVALNCYEYFKNHSCHIEKVLSKQIEQQILSGCNFKHMLMRLD